MAEIDVPGADLLIHCGDATYSGTIQEVARAGVWLRSLPHKEKLFIPGNHDRLFETDRNIADSLFEGITVLHDKEYIWNGYRIWGTSWQPAFAGWAFGINTYDDLYRAFLQIPVNTDILITHCPPYKVLDLTEEGVHAGAKPLIDLFKKGRINPYIHAFGHIHEGYGQVGNFPDCLAINASINTRDMKATNKPIVIELPD